MKILAMLLFWYGLGLVFALAQSPRIFLDFPPVVYEEKEFEISWKIQGEKIKKVSLEKIVQGKKPEIIAKNLPLEGKANVLYEKGASYQITAETKKDVYKKRVSPKFAKVELSEFKANKYEVEEGEEITIHWKASYYTVISIFADSRMIGTNLEHQATLKTRPDTTIYYKIVVAAPKNTIQVVDSFLVKVKKPTFFNLSPVVLAGDSVDIHWSMPYSQKVSLYELEKPLTDEQIATANIPKSIKYKVIQENLPLVGTIHAAPLSPKQTKAYYLLVVENDENQKFFLQKNTELIEEAVKAANKKDLPVTIKLSVNGKFTKPNENYTKYVVNAGDMVRLQWNVSSAASVVVKDFKGKTVATTPEGFKQFSAMHSQYFIVEARDESDTPYASIAYIKVGGRRHFIKNTKDISQLSAKHNYKMEVVEVNRKLYPQKVVLKVIAYDSLGNFITGLGKDPQKYFKNIYETIEGKNTNVKDFEVREIIEEMGESKVISVCTDYSGSMSGTPIETAEKALKFFLQNKYEKDFVSMNKFDDKIANTVALTNSKEKLLKDYKFVGLEGFGGGTALYAGADEALKSIENMQSSEKYLILLTDGYENSSFQYFETHAFTGQQLAERARKLGVKFIVISFGEGTNEALLQALAELTDGYYYNIDEPKNIIGAYQEIPRLFKHYYQISYTPIKGEGKRQFVLQYHDNQKTAKLLRNIQIGERFDITDLDTKAGVALRSGANNSLLFPGKKLIVAPQTIANFQFNKANLEWNYIGNIDKYVKFLQKNPKTTIAIYGHTDLKGEKYKQVKLSEQRAEAIREQFVSKGINASRIKIQACGKNYPLWQTEQYEWQARENRRVEIAIYE